MSKIKSHIIQNYYKNNYLCEEKHSIIWEGKLLIYNSSECNKIYCCKCYPIIVDSKCPNNHHLKETNKFSECNFNGYSCDKCFSHFNISQGVYYDEDCNYTICLNCYKDASDIPDIIED